MNKKQAGIILALLALIVLAAVAAAKINGPVDNLGRDWAIGESKTTSTEDDKQPGTKNNMFMDAKMEKEKKESEMLSSLANISNNKELSKEAREDATKKQKTLLDRKGAEERVQSTLKAKGFEDSICFIQDDGTTANVIVKSKEQLSDKQKKQIQESVLSAAKIKNIQLEIKE